MSRDAPPPAFPDPSDDEDWDEDEAADLVGKLVLVGMTWLEADGETVSAKKQYVGRVRKADLSEGIVIDCEGHFAGEVLTLPPATRFFFVADPGDYSNPSTGEVVSDPDYVSSWTIREPYLS